MLLGKSIVPSMSEKQIIDMYKIGAMSLLQLPTQLSAISTACGAAHKIFSTIDRIPEIDPDSQDGLQPEKVVGEIQFRGVKFAYPTRPGNVYISST